MSWLLVQLSRHIVLHLHVCVLAPALATSEMQEGPYGAESDLWSVGVIMYELLTGEWAMSGGAAGCMNGWQRKVHGEGRRREAGGCCLAFIALPESLREHSVICAVFMMCMGVAPHSHRAQPAPVSCMSVHVELS